MHQNERHTGNTMDIVLDIDALTRGFLRACLEVALEVRDAVLVRVNGVSVQCAELRCDDLEEVLEHVLRFGRLPNAHKHLVSIAKGDSTKQPLCDAHEGGRKGARTVAVCPSSGLLTMPMRSFIPDDNRFLRTSDSSSVLNENSCTVWVKSCRLPSSFRYGTNS